jgi:cytochrome oxidase Cu insertion factor (SCO1/SenC/PrrC family)
MIRFCTFLIFLLLVVTTVMLVVTKNRFSSDTSVSEEKSEGVAFVGGDFNLVNQDGKQVNDKDFRGKVMMVFFGFTSCPDICPVTSATFAKALGLLGDKANSVAPIFITVDPETDTPEVLKEYLSNFDKRIIGLAGTEEQVTQAASAYKAYFSKATNSEGNETVDHSGFIYIMDKNGKYVKHFSYDASAQDVAGAVSDLLK